MPETLYLSPPLMHVNQQRIIRESKRFNVVNCGRRFGKTVLGLDRCMKPLLAGYPVGWFSPEYKYLTEAWRAAKRLYLPVTKDKSEQEHRLELVTGGVLEMWSMTDPNAGRSRKYRRVIVDEAAMAKRLEEAFNESIRPTLSDYRGDAFFLSTPKGRNFYWELWQKGQSPDQPNWASWKMPTAANPYIHPDEIADAKEQLPPIVFSQEYDADFLEVSGRFFMEWDPEKHVILPFDVPDHWTYFGGVDYGTAAPFVFLLCAMDEKGMVYVIDEFYEPRLRNTEMVQGIQTVLQRNGLKPGQVEISFDWANTFPPENVIERRGEYPVEEFWRSGLNCIRAVKDRLAGWSRVRQMLHNQEGIRVFKGRCPNLIRTLPLMVHDERHPEDMDTTLEDHSEDALRYALMSRPQSSLPRRAKAQQFEVRNQGHIISPVVHLPDVFTSDDASQYYL